MIHILYYDKLWTDPYKYFFKKFSRRHFEIFSYFSQNISLDISCSLSPRDNYSRLSLSRLCLSRITAYLEVKTWSPLKHENLTISKKNIVEKRRNCSSLPQYFQYISNFRGKITYSFVKGGGPRFIFFLNSAHLVCRATDISNCFRESFGLRDDKSRLYHEI